MPDEDVTAALVDFFLSTATVGSPDQAGRLLDPLIAGSGAHRARE